MTPSVDEVGLNAASARNTREIDGLQLAAKLGIAEKHHLLPLDLAEHVVLDDDNLYVQSVFHAGGKLAQQHCEAAITDEGDGLTARIGDRRRNGVGKPASHGCEVARARELLVSADVQVARNPSRDRPGVGGNDRIVGDASVQFVGNDLRLHRLIAARPSLFHEPPPFPHAALCLREEAPVLLRLYLRKQRAKDTRAISNQADMSGVSKPDPLRVDVDLNAFGAARFRVELDVREAAPCKSAAYHTLPALPAPASSLTNQRRQRRTGCCREARHDPIAGDSKNCIDTPRG
jgi:hypothetical protein